MFVPPLRELSSNRRARADGAAPPSVLDASHVLCTKQAVSSARRARALDRAYAAWHADGLVPTMGSTSPPVRRRFRIGADGGSDGVSFRVWAPGHRSVDVCSDDRVRLSLARDDQGYFSGSSDRFRTGSRYGFLLDGEGPFPDPASRYQPEGPHGLSEIVDPHRFRWTDDGWEGVRADGQVLYELQDRKSVV